MKLYLSSFLIGNEGHRLASLTDRRRAVVIPNALDHVSGDRQMRVDGQIAELRKLGFDAEELDLRTYFRKPDGLTDDLQDVGLIWATGGNVFLLRRAMRLSGLDQYLIDRKSDDSFAYGGYSAGACVAGPSLRGLDLVDEPHVVAEGYDDEVLWDGLGLISYSVAPHFRSDHPESARIDAVVDYFTGNKMPFVALRDGEVIVTSARGPSEG